MKNLGLRKRKGGALVMVMIVMVVLMILGTAVLRMAVAESRFTARNENKIQAHYLARSGSHAIAEYMIRDAHNDANELIGKTSDWNEQIDGGRFRVTVNKDSSTNHIDIISVGEYRGVTQEAKIRLNPSSSGVGGIFNYAILAKEGITTANSGGSGIEITGDIATKSGTISLGNHGKIINGKADSGKNDLTFPEIVEPINRIPKILYESPTLGKVDVHNKDGPHIISKETPIYVSVDSITLNKSSIKVSGNGIVHMYVKGNIDMDTQSYFDVSPSAKLYIYVIGNRTIKFTGKGNQNNIFLYAPDSNIEWNNSGSGNFFGSIIGKHVTLHNQTKIEHNPNMAIDVDLDNTGAGVTYTGYTWID